MIKNKSDKYFMGLAIKEAKLALKKNQLPVGSVIVLDNKIVGLGSKARSINFRLDHAEMLALRAALDKNHKFADAMTIYTTLEPCIMCFGSILNSRIGRVVYALPDPYGGATFFKSSSMPLRHRIKFPKIKRGLCMEESVKLFKRFFKNTDEPFWQDNTNPLVKLCIK